MVRRENSGLYMSKVRELVVDCGRGARQSGVQTSFLGLGRVAFITNLTSPCLRFLICIHGMRWVVLLVVRVQRPPGLPQMMLSPGIRSHAAIVLVCETKRLWVSEDEWEGTEAYNEIVELLEDGETIAVLYDGYVELRADDGTYLGMVYELDEPVTMRLKVPETLLDVPNGVERKFVVVRGHLSMDGVESAERIEAELVDGWLVFRNRLFSSFAIAYADTTVSAPSTGRFTSGIAESQTKGDYTALLNTVGAMLAMITVFGSFRLYRKIQRKIYRGK